MNWTVTIEKYLQEGRPVSGGKGDSVDKSAEQSQESFNSTLQNAFSSQFAAQSGVLNTLKAALTPELTNPTGLDDATKAALNSSAINNAAQTYQNALKTSQARMSTQGGPTALPNGVQAQIAGQLGAAEANTESQGLQQVQLTDQATKQQSYWNAVSGLSGVASAENPLGFATAEDSGAGAVAGLSSAFTQSNQSQLLGSLGGLAGGALGGWASGGFKIPNL